MRAAYSAPSISRSMLRASRSIRTGSPSRMIASGPPVAASGITCPMVMPLFSPESSPSVTTETVSTRPAPESAAMKEQAKTVPGPPTGPIIRRITMSPATIAPWPSSAIATSSSSNTLAGPANCRAAPSTAESLTIAPPGATLPRMIISPGSGRKGSDNGRM